MAESGEGTKQFSIRIPLSTLDRLDEMAKANYRTRTQEIIRLIEEETQRRQNNPRNTP